MGELLRGFAGALVAFGLLYRSRSDLGKLLHFGNRSSTCQLIRIPQFAHAHGRRRDPESCSSELTRTDLNKGDSQYRNFASRTLASTNRSATNRFDLENEIDIALNEKMHEISFDVRYDSELECLEWLAVETSTRRLG